MSYQNKSFALTTRYNGASFEHDFQKHKKSFVMEPLMYQIPRGKNKGGIHSDKSPTITSNSWEYNNKVIEVLGCALRTWPRIRTGGVNRVKRPEIRQDGKSNALTLVNTDSMVCEPVRIGQYGKGGQGQRIYSVCAKSICLGTGGGKYGKV